MVAVESNNVAGVLGGFRQRVEPPIRTETKVDLMVILAEVDEASAAMQQLLRWPVLPFVPVADTTGPIQVVEVVFQLREARFGAKVIEFEILSPASPQLDQQAIMTAASEILPDVWTKRGVMDPSERGRIRSRECC